MAGRYKIKYIFKEDLENIPRDKARAYLDRQVFSTEEFEKHVDQVSLNLKVDQQIVRDVLISYFTNIFFVVNTVRKVRTKINLYGFASLQVGAGRRF